LTFLSKSHAAENVAELLQLERSKWRWVGVSKNGADFAAAGNKNQHAFFLVNIL